MNLCYFIGLLAELFNLAQRKKRGVQFVDVKIDAEVLGARENEVQLLHAVPQRALHHLE
jgi:flagellar biogenesis protein FliO